MRVRLPVALRGQMMGSIAQTFATRLVVMALGMVFSVIAARALGPAGRGQFAAAAAFAALVAQFGNLGLHSANTYLVGTDRSRLPALLGNTLIVGLGWGAFLGVAAYLISLSPRLVVVEPQLRLLTAVAVPLMLSYMLLQNLTMGMERFGVFNRGELANVVTSLAIMFAIMATTAVTPALLLAASLGGPLLAGTWLLVSLARGSGIASSKALFLRGLTYGWRPYALSVAAFAVSRVDLFVVMSRLGDTQAGYYSVALTLIGIFGTFPAIVGQVLFPRICAIGNLDERWRQTGRTVLWLGVVVIAAAALVALMAGPLVLLLFGAKFLGAVPALRVLLVGAVFMAIHVGVAQYLNGLGYPVAIVILWIGAALLNWRLNLFLVPRHGLLGAAWSSGITYAVVAIGITAIALWYGPRTARGQARFNRERA